MKILVKFDCKNIVYTLHDSIFCNFLLPPSLQVPKGNVQSGKENQPRELSI